MANQFIRKRSPREHFEPAFHSGTHVMVTDDDGNSVSVIKPFSDNGLSASDFSIKSQLASGKMLEPVSLNGLTFQQIDQVNNVQIPSSNE